MPQFPYNLFVLFFTSIIAFAITWADESKKSSGFKIRTIVLALPPLVLLRQVLILSDLISYFPSYLFIAYILVRLIGPLINVYCHAITKTKWLWYHPVNLITGLFFLYIGYEFMLFLGLTSNEKMVFVKNSFHKDNWIATTYPLLQLSHMLWAIWVLVKFKLDKDHKDFMGYYFIKQVVIFTIFMFLSQQLLYLLPLPRTTVEYYGGPTILLVIYTYVLIISFKYSSLYRLNKQGKEETKTENKPTPILLEELSKRENEVFQLLATGLTDQEIADKIHLSPATIRTYCRRIYSKLSIKNRSEATALFLNTQNIKK